MAERVFEWVGAVDQYWDGGLGNWQFAGESPPAPAWPGSGAEDVVKFNGSATGRCTGHSAPVPTTIKRLEIDNGYWYSWMGDSSRCGFWGLECSEKVVVDSAGGTSVECNSPLIEVRATPYVLGFHTVAHIYGGGSLYGLDYTGFYGTTLGSLIYHEGGSCGFGIEITGDITVLAGLAALQGAGAFYPFKWSGSNMYLWGSLQCIENAAPGWNQFSNTPNIWLLRRESQLIGSMGMDFALFSPIIRADRAYGFTGGRRVG